VSSYLSRRWRNEYEYKKWSYHEVPSNRRCLQKKKNSQTKGGTAAPSAHPEIRLWFNCLPTWLIAYLISWRLVWLFELEKKAVSCASPRYMIFDFLCHTSMPGPSLPLGKVTSHVYNLHMLIFAQREPLSQVKTDSSLGFDNINFTLAYVERRVCFNYSNLRFNTERSLI